MILLDPRVGSKHLAPLFEGMGVPFEVTPLEFGDCAFLGNGPDGPVRVGVELKGGRAGSDFIQSMQSDRLVGHQIPGLAESYDRRYLIVEGVKANKNGIIWTPPRRGKVRPIFLADVKRFITGLEESGLRVRFTRTPEDTARVIAKELYAFWQKDYDAHTSVSVLYTPSLFSLTREDPTTARIRRVVVALKAGVGVGRSKAVARRFGSVYDMVTAGTLAEWDGIEGVGKKVAGDVIGAIREGSQVPQVTQQVAAKLVSPRRRAPDRGTRGARRRQDRQLDTGRRAQQRVQSVGAGRRVARRHRSK